MEYSAVRGDRNDGTGVQVIARAAEILRALKGQVDGLSLSQIANKVGLAKSTVYRIVRALEAERFVTSASPNGRIRLGLGLAPLAAWVNTEMRQQIRPYMELLSKEVDETVDLAVLDDNLVFFIDQVVVPHRLQAISAVGATFPLHCTANGKALLAGLPLEQVERVVPEHLQIFTSHTITTREQLLEDLERIRREGIAYDREEHTEGICALGTTIRDAMGNLAAITIPVPSVRFYGNEQHLASALLNIRNQVKLKVEMP